MNYVCKNCGKFVTADEYKKTQDRADTALGCGCFIWLIILLCFVSIILLPIAIILIWKEFNKTPISTCPYCQAKDSLLPEDTPLAKNLIEQNYSEEEQEEIRILQEKQTETSRIEELKQLELKKKNDSLGLSTLVFFIIILILMWIFN